MRKESPQLEFDIDMNNTLRIQVPSGEPLMPEREYRVRNLITFSMIEKIIYQNIEGVKSRNTIDVSTAVGSAIDWFLVPANFIYRFRDDYCFDPERFYTKWDLKDVFSRFYPTGYDFEKILRILEDYRPKFVQNNPLYPANLALERRRIKKALIPVWNAIAKQFKLDSLELQEIMQNENGILLPSGKLATHETIEQIGQRIVNDKFDALIDDDKDYTYIAKPNCLLVYKFEKQTFHIHVQPDYIKRLRVKRKTTTKRQIVAKLIVGDFKDTEKKNLSDFSTPFGKTMLVYNWLLAQIGRNFKLNQLSWVKLDNRQKRRVFLIPQEVKNPVPSDKIQTALEFLQEDNEEIFSPLPKLTADDQRKAKKIFEQALGISKQIKI